jgi:hypothetical protein
LDKAHDPDADRSEQQSRTSLSVEQARLLIATTSERPGLRSAR